MFVTFLVIILGIMDWGRLMLANNFVSYSAREATRYAIVRGSSSPHPAQTSDVATFVKNEAVGLETSKVTVSTTWSPDNNPGSTVAVTVSYAFVPIAPYMPLNMSIASTSKMIIAQ